MKFPVLWSCLGCYTVKCSQILAHIELLYNPRVNKVLTSLSLHKSRCGHNPCVMLGRSPRGNSWVWVPPWIFIDSLRLKSHTIKLPKAKVNSAWFWVDFAITATGLVGSLWDLDNLKDIWNCLGHFYGLFDLIIEFPGGTFIVEKNVSPRATIFSLKPKSDRN